MADYLGNPAQQLAAAWQTATAALGEWREQVTAATAEAKDKIDPAFRAAVEALRSALAGNWGACQCPCATAHPPDKNACDGKGLLTRRASPSAAKRLSFMPWRSIRSPRWHRRVTLCPAAVT